MKVYEVEGGEKNQIVLLKLDKVLNEELDLCRSQNPRRNKFNMKPGHDIPESCIPTYICNFLRQTKIFGEYYELTNAVSGKLINDAICEVINILVKINDERKFNETNKTSRITNQSHTKKTVF